MASPVDAGRQDYDGSTAASSHNVTLPGSIAAGNLLVMALRVPTATTINTPSGWTALVDNSALTVNDHTSILYRWADGSEGATQTVSLGGTVKLAAVTWRITGAENPATQAPEVSSAVSSDVGNPDPGSLSPTGGSKDYLWLWIAGWEGEETCPPSGNPTNYSNTVGADTGTGGAVAGNCRVAGASRQTTAASEDPPAWTTVEPGGWTAWTVGIHPGAAVTNLTPASISHTRGQGSPTVSPSLGPASIVHTRSLGSPAVSPKLGPTSIVHTRAVGSPSVSIQTTLSPLSVEHGRSLGSVVVSPKLSAASIVHTRAVGTMQVILLLGPFGIAHTRALGSPQVNPTISPASVTHTRAIGDPTATSASQLSPASVTHTRALGSPVVSPRTLPASIVHTRALGSPVVPAAPTSIVHTRALGSQRVNPTLVPASLTHTRALGAPTVSSSATPSVNDPGSAYHVPYYS